ncbi:hypothetical protein BDV27DRAFT_161138 [Aspergillus caelatus]|uniref:Uncharacterized protein n=1 Tax=Aspergillus caelatus TaxID=61420 RepID=A0A5N6ZUF4_9EURO|nr:uncharacterized protein BDV27DRAFT_161138 [Aspergillus caelatus]KAE8361018.1 hypothetical protein BDV27DRAFT_161138 [Aspergillus caelatus]
MSTEAQFYLAKERWLAAAKMARTEKEHSKRRYEEDKEMGLIGDQNFEQWAAMNAPGFMQAYNEFQAKQNRYDAIAQAYDPEQALAWKQEFQRRWNETYFGTGEEKGSNFIIITPEDDE